MNGFFFLRGWVVGEGCGGVFFAAFVVRNARTYNRLTPVGREVQWYGADGSTSRLLELQRIQCQVEAGPPVQVHADAGADLFANEETEVAEVPVCGG